MIKRVLIGYGGGAGAGEDPLDFGCALAKGIGAEALVVKVVVVERLWFTTAPLLPPTDMLEPLLSDATVDITAALERRCGGLAARPLARADGSPARGLYTVAEQEEADLIVVGSRGRGPIGRVLIGSTVEPLLEGSPCPVVVVPLGLAVQEEFELRRIGVAFDGLPESRAALDLAQQIAGSFDATLCVISVVEPPTPALPAKGSPPSATGYEERARESLALAERELERVATGAPVHTETELLFGDPGDLLAEAGQGLDLIVAGSRGYGPASRVLLGAVSAKLARTAGCPVLVVPRPPGA